MTLIILLVVLAVIALAVIGISSIVVIEDRECILSRSSLRGDMSAAAGTET